MGPTRGTTALPMVVGAGMLGGRAAALVHAVCLSKAQNTTPGCMRLQASDCRLWWGSMVVGGSDARSPCCCFGMELRLFCLCLDYHRSHKLNGSLQSGARVCTGSLQVALLGLTMCMPPKGALEEAVTQILPHAQVRAAVHTACAL